jgi:short-subunit dehydrogenase
MDKLFEDKVVLITGASSGLGKALAYEFAKNGANVILLARRFELISQIANELTTNFTKCIAVRCDVTKDGEIENAVKEGLKYFKKIDIVIANAGLGIPGNFENIKLEDYRRQFETNVFGVLRTIYATLSELKKSQGHICVIGSVAGYVSFATGSSPYIMSKFAVRGLINPLHLELSQYNISVTHIMPGSIDTEFNKSNDIGKKLGLVKMKPEKAAKLILIAIKNKKLEVILTKHGKLVVFLEHYTPFLLRSLSKIFKKNENTSN